MAFSAAVITHSFTNADLTAASGSITFTLTGRMTNGTTTLVPASITANLDGSGNLSQSLTSNVDVGTLPGDTQWRVDLRVLGASEETFFVTVPTGGGTVDLGSLLPSSQQVG
jgi:hypothetical protein